MIKSMTGYGKAEGSYGQKKLTVEIKSLNSKQLDMNVRMPSIYKQKELHMRSTLAKTIKRGKVDIAIFYDSTGDDKKAVVNQALLESYYTDLKKANDAIGQQDVDYMGIIMRIPDVLKSERPEFDEGEWSAVWKLILEANKNFNEYRDTEGTELQKDFATRIENIQALYRELDGPLADRVTKIRERVETNLKEFIENDKLDQNRFEQELIYYLEKLDVSEEQQRLEQNCVYFLEVLNSNESEGKKLGFIAQEIGREINTMGSKANDADIQRIVVQMKDELEKIKEQVLNAL